MVTNTLFPGMNKILDKILDDTPSTTRKFVNVFEGSINIIELALHLFIGMTVRFYENKIVEEEEGYRKKVRPITELLRDRFAAPSLGTLVELARLCVHLIGDEAPPQLKRIKALLLDPILLTKLGDFLSDLDRLFLSLEEEDFSHRGRVLIRSRSRQPLLQSVLVEFTRFRNDSAHLTALSNLIEENEKRLNLSLEVWRDGFQELVDLLSPIFANTFRRKSLGRVLTGSQPPRIAIEVTTYIGDEIRKSDEAILLDDWREQGWDSLFEIVLAGSGTDVNVDLYPFVITDGNDIYLYKKTKASGYLYFSPAATKTLVRQTKKKFNHSVFRSRYQGGQQGLFWTEVLPTFNSLKTVKANIPLEGFSGFIGRKKQLSKIREDVIEIPNQHGIVFGPGGVGKTALMLELSRNLFMNETNIEPLFSNIIWVSAKTNFYNPVLNVVEAKPQQFSSLDEVFNVILHFFDYEDVEEYSPEDKREIVLEILQENVILLILDNFETISKHEADEIVKFFGLEVKRHLKSLPKNFKLILTSRESIPTAFHHIKLEGLDSRESRLLMKNQLEQYGKDAGFFTEDQFKRLHEVTLGIPIVIKHSFGQLFEYNLPLDKVLNNLAAESNEVIQFSYREILSLLDKDEVQKKILLLLEIVQDPVSIRQGSEILELPTKEITQRIAPLLAFQCLDRVNIGVEERFIINPQIGLLSKTLLKNNADAAKEIRALITKNLSLEMKMDYTPEEFQIVEIFDSYLAQRDLGAADSFLRAEIKNRPTSKLLRLTLAKFRKNYQNEFEGAIEILEKLKEETKSYENQHPVVLRELAKCYRGSDPPAFEKANLIYSELLKITNDPECFFEAGECYVVWSTHTKLKSEQDPIKGLERRARYKELAGRGIELLNGIPQFGDQHKYHFLLAHGYFNLWENERALKHIDKALDLAKGDIECCKYYLKFRRVVTKQMSY